MVSEPRKSEVTVWWMELGSTPAAVVADWQTCLNAAERLQAERFHFEEDRSAYIAAHWLVRNALASVGGVRAQDWRFIAEERGKPQIDPIFSRTELQFNLSHTRGFVACAVCVGSVVGIDVERLAQKLNVVDIAARFFSLSELAILRDAVPDHRSDTFIRLWTLKEALIKATGEGLHRALDSFSFSLDPVAITFNPKDVDDPSNWEFIEHRPTPRHRLAIAVRQPADLPVNLTICRVQPA